MQRQKAKIVWFSGLSGAGKSTICFALADKLEEHMIQTQILDGDSLRQNVCSDLGFDMKDRFENVRRVAYLANILAENGIVVLVGLITPLEEMRELVRSIIGDVLEVYVNAPLQVCEARDPKGLYRKARSGILNQFTGVDSPFEIPTGPHVICNTHHESITESVLKVFERIFVSSSLTDEQQGERRTTIAVDFDGVIADYDGWNGINSLGLPRRDVVTAMNLLRTEGWKIIIYSCRASRDIQGYLERNQIPYDEINQNSDYNSHGQKPVATVYWDDRAIRYSGDAQKDISFIRSFRTWNGRR